MSRKTRRLLTVRPALVGGLAVLALMAGISAPASAGTLNLQLGLDPTGCIASGWFATGMTGSANCSSTFNIFKYGTGWSIYPAYSTIGAGWTGQWQINAPSGITIDAANLPSVTSYALVSPSSHGWQAASYWAGGNHVWSPSDTSEYDGSGYPYGLNSSYYGFKLYCYASSCNNQGYVDVGEVDVQATENQGPAIAAVGSGNLWYQGSGWVWNPSGNPWPADVSATDSSGACLLWVSAGPNTARSPASMPNTHLFQQCPSPASFAGSQGAQVDTNQLVRPGSSGSFTLTLGAQNAAGVQSTPSETINVDQVQPSVSLATPNDPNPGGWAVNHAVTVTAAGHTGPSGLTGLTCSVDGGPTKAYPSGGVSVDGNGKHRVSCTAANGAVGPQGQHNTGTASTTIDIDEQPPTLTIQPQSPSDPAQVVVQTSDSESQVAGGQIQIAPKGTTNWTSIPTSFTNTGQLIGTINDAGLTGPYTVQASACSQVGNCGSTSETLTMPLRLAAVAKVSFGTIVDRLVAKKVRERVRVGWHWAAVLRHGKAVKVKRGGHWKKVTVTKYVERCTYKRRRVGKHRWELKAACRLPHLQLRDTKRVAYGKKVTVNGLLLSGQGVAMGGVPVQILTAPDNGSGQYTPVATVTTNSAGAWRATLPAGPSRLIEATYAGSPTILPASGQATITVPARVRIKITPRVVPWGTELRVTGKVLGGYVPTNSSLLRLNVGIGRLGQLVGLPSIKPNGQFVIHWRFKAGRGVLHPWFSVGTLSEAAFPYAPGTSRRVVITVGRRTPKAPHAARRHHKLSIHRLGTHKHRKHHKRRTRR